jgi:hypothetical protein
MILPASLTFALADIASLAGGIRSIAGRGSAAACSASRGGTARPAALP